MGYLIIIVAMMIIGGVISWRNHRDVDISVLDVILGFIIGLIISSVACLVLSGNVEYEDVKTVETEIVAMSNGTSVEGSFFLGSGTIEGKSKYFYVEETERGARLRDIPADNSYVIEDNTQVPTIITYVSQPKSEFVRKWFPVIETKTYDIIIPEGSIIRDFKIDLN